MLLFKLSITFSHTLLKSRSSIIITKLHQIPHMYKKYPQRNNISHQNYQYTRPLHTIAFRVLAKERKTGAALLYAILFWFDVVNSLHMW